MSLTAAERRLHAAANAFEARLDRDFGNGFMRTYLADAFADGIERLRRRSGLLNGDEVSAFLQAQASSDFAVDAADVTDAENDEQMRDILLSAVELVDDFEEFAGQLIGPITFLAGVSSDDYAVMTAGSIYVNAMSRNGRYTTFWCGDDETDPYVMQGAIDGAPDFEDAQAAVSGLGGGDGAWTAYPSDFERARSHFVRSTPASSADAAARVARAAGELLGARVAEPSEPLSPDQLDDVIAAWPAALESLRAPIRAAICEAQPIGIERGAIVFATPPKRFEAISARFRSEAVTIKGALASVLGSQPRLIVRPDDFDASSAFPPTDERSAR